MKEELFELTDSPEMRGIPCRAAQGSTRAGQEAKGVGRTSPGLLGSTAASTANAGVKG